MLCYYYYIGYCIMFLGTDLACVGWVWDGCGMGVLLCVVLVLKCWVGLYAVSSGVWCFTLCFAGLGCG